MNNIAGLGHWRIIAEEVFCEQGEYSSGRKAYEVGYDVIIRLGNWTPAGFQVLAETPKTPGGHVSALKTDTRKGALTNAIKKAIAFFGIGAAAYRGELDDDNLPPEGRQLAQGYTRQAVPATRQQTQPAENGRQNKSSGEARPGSVMPEAGQAEKNMNTLPDWATDEPPGWMQQPAIVSQPVANGGGNGGAGNGNGRRRLF
ncbi:MAG TPA: hypothetical protein DCK76_01235 [Desulfotomaculum sp.]|nr:MAG: hypothetical protein XD84_1916 [Desulfotomaculum sp. 46_80]HAG10037.1 hypothetical protein [Desulfotomaculum sp.]HBY04515.1 hypothetical protein [Desulfotomaculum sp.]